MPKNHVLNYSVREYAGCPHCGGPVNIGVEINTALASFASAVLPLLPDEVLQKSVGRMALQYDVFARMAEEESDSNLAFLNEVIEKREEEARKKKAESRPRASRRSAP